MRATHAYSSVLVVFVENAVETIHFFDVLILQSMVLVYTCMSVLCTITAESRVYV